MKRTRHAIPAAIQSQVDAIMARNRARFAGWSMDASTTTRRLDELEELISSLTVLPEPTRSQEQRLLEARQEWRTLVARQMLDGAQTDVGLGIAGSQFSSVGSGSSSAALRMVEEAHASRGLEADAAERAEALLRNGSERSQFMAAAWVEATGSEAYTRAFAKVVMHGREDAPLRWTDEERAAFSRAASVQDELRSMSLLDAAGGYLVPWEHDPTIRLTNAGFIDPMRALARVEQTVTDVWHGVTSAGVTAEWLGENQEVSDASPTLEQPEVPAEKGGAWVEFSFELQGDAVRLVEQIGGLLSEAAERLRSEAYTLGDGNKKPVGFVPGLAGTSSVVTSITPESLTAADVYKLQNALDPRWQSNAAWMASPAILNTLDQFETGNGARKFPSLDNGQLLRHRIEPNSWMDSTINASATENNYLMAYGSWRDGYLITDRVGTSIELDPMVKGANRRPNGKRGLLMWFRTGGGVINANALRILNTATTA